MKMVSGQKITQAAQDSGLNSSLQNSSVEFAAGWREKAIAQMTEREVDYFFSELILLIEYEGGEM